MGLHGKLSFGGQRPLGRGRYVALPHRGTTCGHGVRFELSSLPKKIHQILTGHNLASSTLKGEASIGM